MNVHVACFVLVGNGFNSTIVGAVVSNKRKKNQDKVLGDIQ